jgi:alanine racemase
MLGVCLPEETDSAVRDDVALTVSSAEDLHRIADSAKRLRRVAAVHLKVDTGMGRLGAAPRDAVNLLREILAAERVRVEGLYTHFSSAEDDAAFTAMQWKRFQSTVASVRRAGLPVPMLHACNSAGLLHEPEAVGGMVRPGLLIYGLHPRGRRAGVHGALAQLQPALNWKARIGLVRYLPKGATVGYGHTFTAPRRMRVAVVTAGYGDGYSRAGSSRAAVLVGGRRCRVLGRVTMDQMVVDVSALDAVEAGDEVVLIGRQGGEMITAHELAEWSGAIPWEICTAITHRVPRVYRGATAA